MARKKKTHEEYVAELAIKNPTVEVVGQYINSETKITHHCLKHDVYWEIKPNNALQGKGCKECQKEKYREKRVKTHEQYLLDVSIKNPTVKVVEKYIDKKTPILHYCIIHSVYWKASPTNILAGKGCNKCMKDKVGNALIKLHSNYIEELAVKNPSVKVVDEYINSITPITHHCLTHDIYWKAAPNNILNGEGCIECKKEKLRKSFAKSHRQYIENITNINPQIEVIETYINAKTPILHRCKIDGAEWYASPENILAGRGCPQCNESNGERYVRLWLDNNNFKYIREKSFCDCVDKKCLPFDFYLPDYNVVIEYQGQQHYHPVEIFGGEEVFKKQQKHDNIKREYCKNNNIRLLEIPYYKNIEEELNNFLFI